MDFSLTVSDSIPFNRPSLSGSELEYIADAVQRGQISGDGHYTQLCHRWLEEHTGCTRALLTHSCTAALEMAAILADIGPGDEIIMPSYTFVSTANAFALRGGVPVFVDIRPDTLNIDERLIEDAITPRTRAIVPVHYGGVACEMDAIMEIARHHRLIVIEDAAQAVLAMYKGKPLGSIGHFGCMSFHETKNLIAGEGGALIINSPEFVSRAEIIREKGTNRNQFFRGQVDKYRWVDIGSSYLPGEIAAAFLFAQLENGEKITERRLLLWHRYNEAFREIEPASGVCRPFIPDTCLHNGHLYYLLLRDLAQRTLFISSLRRHGINAAFHYVPLHSAPAGRLGRFSGSLPVTDSISERLVRLPLWPGLECKQAQVIEVVLAEIDNYSER